MAAGLPPYTSDAVDWHTGWSMKLTKAELAEVKILMA